MHREVTCATEEEEKGSLTTPADGRHQMTFDGGKMAASGGKVRRLLSVDRELQAVGNNWTVNGQGSGSDGSGSDDGEMDGGSGSLEEWKVVKKKRKNKDRDESDVQMVAVMHHKADCQPPLKKKKKKKVTQRMGLRSSPKLSCPSLANFPPSRSLGCTSLRVPTTGGNCNGLNWNVLSP
ncbi:unnamed protein product [Leuciscus chuanchicus]